MKKHIGLLFIIILTGLKTFAQTSTSHQKNITTICSLVNADNSGSGTVSKDGPLILYMQDSVNNKKIQIVFSQATRKTMSYDPFNKLVNQNVCISGKITQYNNAPAIVIHNEQQIKTKDDSQMGRNNVNE